MHRRHNTTVELEKAAGIRDKEELVVDGKLNLKFQQKVTNPTCSYHTQILATSKPDFFGKDFFARPEFRGLINADYQTSIGAKAQHSVDLLNQTTVSKFPTLQFFNESVATKRRVDHFYRNIGQNTLQAKRYSNRGDRANDPPVSTMNSTEGSVWQNLQSHPILEVVDSEAVLMNEQLSVFEDQLKAGSRTQNCHYKGANKS